MAVLTTHSRWSDLVDNYFYDLLLEHIPSSNINPPAFAVLAIDDESLEVIKAPLVLWIQYFSTVIDAILHSGTNKNPNDYICIKLALCDEDFTEPSIWIDYRFNKEQIKTHSFKTILSQSEEQKIASLKSDFQRKVVFIGPTSDKLNDIHVVPFSPIDKGLNYAPGIMVHAMSALSILSKSHLKSTPEHYKIWGTALIAFFVSLLVLFTSPVRSIIILLATVIVGGIIGVKAFSSFLVIPASPLVFGFIIPIAISGSYLYIMEYRQLRTLQKYFKSYVNNEVMQEIIQHPERIDFKGSMVNVSIMFVDIRDFTSISAKLSPSEVLVGLNKYLTEMTNAIISSGGYVNRYLGDGILAINQYAAFILNRASCMGRILRNDHR